MIHIPSPPIAATDKHKIARWEFYLNVLQNTTGTFQSLHEDIEVLDAQWEGVFEVPPQDAFTIYGGNPNVVDEDGNPIKTDKNNKPIDPYGNPFNKDDPAHQYDADRDPQPYDNNIPGKMAVAPWLNAMKVGNTSDLPLKRKTIALPENGYPQNASIANPNVTNGMLRVQMTIANVKGIPGDLFKYRFVDANDATKIFERVYEIAWVVGTTWFCNPGILPVAPFTASLGLPQPATSIRIRLRGQPQLIEEQDRQNYGGHTVPWKEAFA